MAYRYLDSTVLGAPLQRGTYHIVGAGISGLLIGYFLKKKKIPFKIYEISGRAGGLIRSDRNQLGISEAAANGFLWCEEIQAIADEVGADLIAPSENAGKKFLVRNKKPHTFPLTFTETLPLIMRTLLPHFTAPQTLQEFGDTYFGKKFSEQILNPAMGGIYAADIEQTSFPGSLPVMAKLIEKSKWLPLAFAWHAFTGKKSKKKGIYSFRGGMQTFIDRLSEFLKGDLLYRQDALQLSNSQENMMITAPPPVAARFFRDDVGNLLLSIQNPPIVSATLVFNKKAFARFRDGFGCLIPRNENLATLGILFNSVIFEDRVFSPEHISLACIANNPQLLSQSDTEILSVFEKEIDLLFGLKEKPLEYTMYRHQRGIPLYTPQLYHQWFMLNTLLQNQYPHIRLFSNYTGQISIRGLAQQAAKATHSL